MPLTDGVCCLSIFVLCYERFPLCILFHILPHVFCTMTEMTVWSIERDAGCGELQHNLRINVKYPLLYNMLLTSKC